MNKHAFRLYVAGVSPNSLVAIRNLEAFCLTLPQDSYDLEVVDVLVQPSRALRALIFATPTLEFTTPSGHSQRLLGTLKQTTQLRSLVASAENR